ncbi:MAG: polysaccharide lyase [Candidatus Thiodiazotropha endolucinida]|nr:polysaccharide lyase [Candidatus Thiodiazotropha taylori]MCW4344830.1 polysaccharide lyase [Candidatus Thiodiazotropha endolucinida]
MRKYGRPSYILGSPKWFNREFTRAVRFELSKGAIYGFASAHPPITDPRIVVSYGGDAIHRGGAIPLSPGAASGDGWVYDNYAHLNTRSLVERPGRIKSDGVIFEAYVLCAGILNGSSEILHAKATAIPPNAVFINISSDVKLSGFAGPTVLYIDLDPPVLRGNTLAVTYASFNPGSPRIGDDRLRVDGAPYFTITGGQPAGQGQVAIDDPEPTIVANSPILRGEVYYSDIFKIEGSLFSKTHLRGYLQFTTFFKIENLFSSKAHLGGNAQFATDSDETVPECYTRIPAVFSLGNSNSHTLEQRIVNAGIGQSLVFCYSTFDIFNAAIPDERSAPTVNFTRMGPVFDFQPNTRVMRYAPVSVSDDVTLMMQFKQRDIQSWGHVFDNYAGLIVFIRITGEPLVVVSASMGSPSESKEILLPVTPGEWHTLIVTLRRDSGTSGFVTVWLDGVEISTTEGVSEHWASIESPHIGGSNFNGSIAKVCYWHRILNKHERDKLNSIKFNFNR